MPYTPRSISVIKAQIVAQIATYPALSALTTNTSAVAVFNLMAYIVAVSINLLEQLMSVFQSNVEAEILAAPVGSEPWLQSKIFQFQYDSTIPQVVTLINFSPQYAIVDATKQIISRCSVITGSNGQVTIKVATGSTPTVLSAPQLSALQSYVTGGGSGTYSGRGRGIGFAGINYQVFSRAADLIYIAGTITYNGQYSSTIQASVIAAVNNYLANIPFSGYVSLLSLTDAIQSVVGVNDIFLTDVAVRNSTQAFTAKTYMMQSKTTIITSYQLYAGYVVNETSPNDMTNSLIFAAN